MAHTPKEQNLRYLSSLKSIDQLILLSFDECLQNIANTLRKSINCEAVCILLWCEAKQRLITVQSSGLHSSLNKPEFYGPNEGLTGKYFFSQEKRLRCLVDFRSKVIKTRNGSEQIFGQTIQWKNMIAFKSHSRFKDFRSVMGAPFFVEEEEWAIFELHISKRDALVRGRGVLSKAILL